MTAIERLNEMQLEIYKNIEDIQVEEKITTQEKIMLNVVYNYALSIAEWIVENRRKNKDVSEHIK